MIFEPGEYQRLEAYARREKVSVGAVVRDSVRHTLGDSVTDRLARVDRMFSRADENPAPVGDWANVKHGFERNSLMDIS